MRYAVLALTAASLALAGCGKKEATGNTSALDEAVSAEDFATNDATAIDAATGADANMAADVEITVINNLDDGNGSATTSSGARSTARPKAGSSSSSNTTNASQPVAAPTPEPIEPAPLSNAG
jgi:hypothetical protein